MTSIPNKSRLSRDRWAVEATLAEVALCWGWIAPMGLDMYGPMTGCSAWMMTRTWDFTHQALLFAMWGAVIFLGWILANKDCEVDTQGDYRVKDGSPALSLGFVNFSMNYFGLQGPAFKALARTPVLPGQQPVATRVI